MPIAVQNLENRAGCRDQELALDLAAIIKRDFGRNCGLLQAVIDLIAFKHYMGLGARFSVEQGLYCRAPRKNRASA